MTDREILEKLFELLPKEKEGAIAPYVKEIKKDIGSWGLGDGLFVTIQETEQADTLGEYCFRFFDDGLELVSLYYRQIPAKG